MKRILLVVLIVGAIGAWYGYREYNRKNVDLSDSTPIETVNALALIAAFEKDTAFASNKYIDKVIAVTGTVKKIEDDGTPVVLFLGDEAQLSSVLCSMDSSHARSYATLKVGSKVTIKGIVNGYQADELLGTDVKINRCVTQ